MERWSFVFVSSVYLNMFVNHISDAAELSQCKTEINTRLWKLTATCHVNKLFSSREKVHCGVARRQNVFDRPVTMNPRFPCHLYLQNYTDTTDNNTYQRGTCNFTSHLPISAGNYSYIIQITPVTAQKTAVEVWIDNLEPNCEKFLQENPSGSCDCFKRDPRSVPTPVHSDTRATTNYVCTIVRGSTSHVRRSSLSTTSQTPYGLQSVRISTNATQPFVTDGTVQMTLVCEADDLHTAVKYTWAGVTCINENHEHGTCIFTPRVPQDDGHWVWCSAYNEVSIAKRILKSYTIQLRYPPRSPPNIRGYREGWILTEGENITLSCVVKGGKPKVSSVTFFCGDEPDKQDSVDNKFVWSSVIINPKAQHNNTVCECKATWNPKPEFYSYITSVRLYVRERTASLAPSETTRKLHREQPAKTPVRTSKVTHLTTFPSLKGLGSSPLRRLKVSPVSQSPLGSLRELLQLL